MKQYRNTAIILAAGQGSRMGSGTRKQYMNLGGAPLFTYSLRTMEKSPVITDIVLVLPKGDEAYVRQILREQDLGEKVRAFAAGGAERYYSVYNGLKVIDWPCDYVFIHDGARPFIDEATLGRLLVAATETGACAAGMPSKDTVRITDNVGKGETTPDRSRVWIVQTPQVFERELIMQAYEQMLRTAERPTEQSADALNSPDSSDSLSGGASPHVTDDAMAVEQMAGRRVQMVEASYRNIKITTPEDLLIAEAFLTSPKPAR